MSRGLHFLLTSAVVSSCLLAIVGDQTFAVAAGSVPPLQLNVSQAGPRQVEDSTRQAVTRDYAAAWKALASALEKNRTDLLSANFVGTASEKLSDSVSQQRKSGLHQRWTDNGHQADVMFYSPEGSAMELRDTVQLHIELMDGDRVVHSEEATIHYLVLLTAAENSWKVRVLEAVPAF
jgi:hypothetical protein